MMLEYADAALPSLAPAAVAARLRLDAGEWAFLDVREVGEAANGHPFASTNLPYSRLELDLPDLVPKAGTPLVLIDGGNGVANRAARRLRGMDRHEIVLVAGGIPGWVAAGLPLFKGVHTWSKAFGEWVRRRFAVPEIGPQDLAAELAGATPPTLIDVRPLAEYQAFTLPDSRNCPNAELALCLPGLATADERIILHCAGRTRSIIGAQTVRDFRLANEVAALRDGTQGWELAGYSRELGTNRRSPAEPTAAELAGARDRARDTMLRNGIPFVAVRQMTDWLRRGEGTVYRFDPRPEGEATVPAGFRSAPGTTLIQQVDRFVAVRGARVILWDPLLVRAAFAALWLRRMGIAAFVLDGAPPAADPAPAVRRLPPRPPVLSVAGLAAHRAAGGIVVDMRPTAAWRTARLAGARRASRSTLDRLSLPAAPRVAVLTAEPDLAAVAAVDLAEAGATVVGFCRGAPEDWGAAGLFVETRQTAVEAAIDEDGFCAGRHSGRLDDARAYLDWEAGLLEQLEAADIVPWSAAADEQDKSEGDRR